MLGSLAAHSYRFPTASCATHEQYLLQPALGSRREEPMPIPTDQLTLNGPSDQAPKFIVLPPDATIGAALAALPRRRSLRAFVYVVVPLAGDARGSFLVPRWIEVELLADALGRDI